MAASQRAGDIVGNYGHQVQSLFGDHVASRPELRGHLGIDMGNRDTLKNVYAVADGTVKKIVETTDPESNGYSVTIKHEIDGQVF